MPFARAWVRNKRVYLQDARRVIADRKRALESRGDASTNGGEREAKRQRTVGVAFGAATEDASTSSSPCVRRCIARAAQYGCCCELDAIGACRGHDGSLCAARRRARDEARGGVYVAGIEVRSTPHEAEKTLELVMIYRHPRTARETRCVVALHDFILGKTTRRVLSEETKSAKQRYDYARARLAQFVPSAPLDWRTATNEIFFSFARESRSTCGFLVTSYDASICVYPLMPYRLVWRSDPLDDEDVMHGELLDMERLLCADNKTRARGRERANVQCRKQRGVFEVPSTRASAPLPKDAPAAAYELFGGVGEISVQIANRFPSLGRIYMFEWRGRIVCDAARRHPRVTVVVTDIRTMNYVFVPPGAFVWASPPCEGYSPQRRSEFAKKGPEFAKSVLELADTYVRVTLDFIRAAAALCWVLENPSAELRNRMDTVGNTIDYERFTVTYCKYGFDYRKRTDLFVSCALGATLRANGGFKAPCAPKRSPCDLIKCGGNHPCVAAGLPAWVLGRVPVPLVDHILNSGVAPYLAATYGNGDEFVWRTLNVGPNQMFQATNGSCTMACAPMAFAYGM
jgi:hypothetical protein